MREKKLARRRNENKNNNFAAPSHFNMYDTPLTELAFHSNVIFSLFYLLLYELETMRVLC